MNFSRLLFAIVAGCCLPGLSPLFAADDLPPFTMEKHYSADVIISTQERGDITSKTYVDGDKMRSDVSTQGMNMSLIVRKDKQKVYQLMVAQKMAMEMPYDPAKYKGNATASMGPEGKFELIGPDTVNGVACTKYKVTPDKSKEVYFFWLDTAQKVPVQMTDAGGTFKVQWKNFKAGPQEAALFEVPSDYTVMPMPNLPGAPSQGGPGDDGKPHF